MGLIPAWLNPKIKKIYTHQLPAWHSASRVVFGVVVDTFRLYSNLGHTFNFDRVSNFNHIKYLYSSYLTAVKKSDGEVALTSLWKCKMKVEHLTTLAIEECKLDLQTWYFPYLTRLLIHPPWIGVASIFPTRSTWMSRFSLQLNAERANEEGDKKRQQIHFHSRLRILADYAI